MNPVDVFLSEYRLRGATDPWFYLLTALCALGLYLAQSFIAGMVRNSKYKLPPRVPGVPIFGNSFQPPATQQGPWAKKLAEKYGEMYVSRKSPVPQNICADNCNSRFTVTFGGSTWVFLNSSRVVNDLMERRAAIYCSRPQFPMAQGIISRDARILLMPYNDQWRQLRKIMHNILSTRQKDVFRPFQDLESKHLLYDYLHKPEKWYVANGRFANSVIMSVVFGRRSDMDNPNMRELFETIDVFLEEQQPGVNIVDAFPVLTRLPKFMQWWRGRGERIFEMTRR